MANGMKGKRVEKACLCFIPLFHGQG